MPYAVGSKYNALTVSKVQEWQLQAGRVQVEFLAEVPVEMLVLCRLGTWCWCLRPSVWHHKLSKLWKPYEMALELHREVYAEESRQISLLHLRKQERPRLSQADLYRISSWRMPQSENTLPRNECHGLRVYRAGIRQHRTDPHYKVHYVESIAGLRRAHWIDIRQKIEDQ